VLVVGTIIGLIWADTSNVAGSIAVATNILGGVGIVVLLIALAVVTRRQRRAVRFGAARGAQEDTLSEQTLDEGPPPP
jgi:hypothetical protein